MSQGAPEGIPPSLLCRDPFVRVRIKKAREVRSDQLPPYLKHPRAPGPCICPLLTITLCAVPQQLNINVIFALKEEEAQDFSSPFSASSGYWDTNCEEEVGRWCLSAEMPLEEHKNTPDRAG